MARRIQRGTTRTALGLYGSLLVLPTLIFGYLYWRELEKDFDGRLEAVPQRAKLGAERILGGVKKRFDRLIEAEEARPIYQYGEVYASVEARGDQLQTLRSPMVAEETSPGILAWFSYEDAPDSEIEVYTGASTFGLQGNVERYRAILEDFRGHLPQAPSSTSTRFSEESLLGTSFVPMGALAVMLAYQRDPACVDDCYPSFRGRTIRTGISDFRLHFYRDEQGAPHAVATRRVLSSAQLVEVANFGSHCMQPYIKGFGLTQGFLIDDRWLLTDLPFDTAEQALADDEELRSEKRKTLPIETSGFPEPIFPIRALEFTTFNEEDKDYGELVVVVDTDRINERIRRQSTRFFTVGGMLVFTLAAGMSLLYRSVRNELEQARRIQNFVAAVTHELRTPLSTIRLHAEMLLDGWVSDPSKQTEYYQRIMRETGRLSTLVERILEKSRLKDKGPEPEPTDLNAMVESLREDLETPGVADLALDLGDDLPRVWLTREALSGILSNLVENARKYAPGSAEAPIVIRTRKVGNRVNCDVLDRGPGVPDSEREKIFEAFYRVGSEATRTTIGTGLGLHLVSLHAEACRAEVSVHDRAGGGSLFRVAFRPA